MLNALEREKAGAGEKVGASMSVKATFNVDVLSRVTGGHGDMETWGEQSGHNLHGPGSSRRGAAGGSGGDRWDALARSPGHDGPRGQDKGFALAPGVRRGMETLTCGGDVVSLYIYIYIYLLSTFLGNHFGFTKELQRWFGEVSHTFHPASLCVNILRNFGTFLIIL